MTKPTWTCFDLTARWRHADFSAVVSLQRPDRGLHDVQVHRLALVEAELLGLVLPNTLQEQNRVPVEYHPRGCDLIAQYPESASWPVCVDVVWRVIPSDAPRGVLAGVELIASVRTALLDSWPELAVGSRIVAEAAFQLADAATGRFEPCGVLGAERILETAGPGLFVARLARTPFSYAEMVHPADGEGSTLAGSGEQATLLRTRHRLFAERLEKGVLLRSRVRGVLLDRVHDLQVAAGCYAEFAAAEPPLGT